jgi:glycosyltransferase involved in cell wall biosynthesis
MVDVYRDADVLVWPARKYLKENTPAQSIGFPRVIIEALACGVPVVASDLEGVEEAIKDGETGILISPDDESAFADAIIQLAKDRRRRESLVLAAREHIVRDFSIETHVRRFERTLESVLNGQKNGRNCLHTTPSFDNLQTNY